MTKSNEIFALITAGGSGKRMGYKIPKQFIELLGRPVLMYTIERFYRFDKKIKIILCLPKNKIVFWQQLCIKHNFNIKHKVVSGGSERFFSVRNALKYVSSKGLIAIHDGVRPFVSNETLFRCFNTANRLGNAVAVMDITFSIRKIVNSENISQKREYFKEVQTPQVFETELIKTAYNQKFVPEFTDDASVFEKYGFDINIVEGNRENIKLTNPFDLIIAKAILENNKNFK